MISRKMEIKKRLAHDNLTNWVKYLRAQDKDLNRHQEKLKRLLDKMIFNSMGDKFSAYYKLKKNSKDALRKQREDQVKMDRIKSRLGIAFYGKLYNAYKRLSEHNKSQRASSEKH